MNTYLVKIGDGIGWIEVGVKEVYSLYTLFPGTTLMVLNANGEEITAEFMANLRSELIYG